MDLSFLQNIDLGSVWPIILCVVGLCVVGVVLFFGLQLFNVVFGFFQVFLDILAGGPIAWCGCLLIIFICIGCGVIVFGIANSLPKCGTVEATNLCRLFGY